MASLLDMSGGRLLGKGLPYDAEIEYLESSGTQWIGTGIIPTNVIIDAVICTLSTNSAWASYFSCIGKQCTAGAGSPNTYFYGELKGGNTGHISLPVGLKSNIKINTTTGRYEVNDNVRTVTGSTEINSELFLFAKNNGSSVRYSSAIRIYSFSITQNSTLIRDFIPVRVGQVGYLYDKVSGQLFGNSGTGNFILGPDKTN